MATAPLNGEDFLAGHFLLRHLCAEELGFPLEWRGEIRALRRELGNLLYADTA